MKLPCRIDRPSLRLFALGLLPSAFCLYTASAQLRITPPADPDSTPGITVRPVPEDDEPTPTPEANNDDPETLKQRLKETEVRLRAYEKGFEATNRRNEQLTTTVHGLTESLAVANADLEVFRRKYTDLSARMEAFGLASVGDNKEGLQERLLQAVNDLRLVRDEKNKLADGMMGLTESVLLYIKSAAVSDPQLRLQVEAQIRAANEAVDQAAAQEAPASKVVENNLNNGKVLSVKEDLSLVLFDLGSLQGVKIGAPFLIVRGDRFVARVRVVEVRERFSGAVVEDYSSNTEKVKVGDTVRVDVQS